MPEANPYLWQRSNIQICASHVLTSIETISAPNGGYRTSSNTQCKLRRVTGRMRLLAADRRIGVPEICASHAGDRAQTLIFCLFRSWASRLSLAIPAHPSWPRPPARSCRRQEPAIVGFLACRAIQSSEKITPAGQRGYARSPVTDRLCGCARRPSAGDPVLSVSGQPTRCQRARITRIW